MNESLDAGLTSLVLDHKWVLYDRLPGADAGGGGIVWRAQKPARRRA